MIGTVLSPDILALKGRQKLRPTAVILLGPPGAGKGTHAGPLSLYLGIPHISTGDLFRENIRKQTPIGIKAKEYIDKGKLVPDEIVLNMLFERTSKPDCLKGYILDGFPRTVPQAEALNKKIGITHEQIVLNFVVPDSFLVERITGRLACKGCGKPFHKKMAPPKQEGICDDCGHPLYLRDDDREDVLRKRLEVYKRETQPLIHYYQTQQNILKEVDSKQEKEKVFQNVLEALPARFQPAPISES